ncbi:peptidyl-prolyl cis-trans isomerase D [Ferrovum myxofaciens]|uniref:Periplasmic chaperone PpiD n=1 Tax=Ferrovum myxofaciens TaxID=416213 RepID=A0A149VYL5_9PROT|nr:SurA N-terminal domain-containing protein [Ferrovum myxofaciens]KXW58311.1 peptidyl-prolyl cis-trans isomerase D [Ferrovum myxofaciens]
MLDGFRSLSQTWVAKVVLVLITVPFALFGLEYYLRQGGGGGAVLKVDGVAISQSEFRDALRNQQQQMQNAGGVDSASLSSPALRYEAMNALVNRQLLLKYADDHHLTIPDQLLVDEISRVDVFQENGKFSQSRYEQVLRAQGMTPAQFEKRLRADLKLQLEQESLTTTAWVPEQSLDAFLKLDGQIRAVSTATLGSAQFLGKVKLAADAVKKYYEAHPNEFRISEQVSIQYLTLAADQLAAAVTVLPEELRKAYADPANQSRWTGQEMRRARHILLTIPNGASPAQRQSIKQHAQQLLVRLQAHPEQFAAVAKVESQDPGSASQGGDLGFFARGTMTPPFEKAVFALNKGEFSGPVETDFGYHVIQVTDIHEAKHLSLEEVTPQLTAEIRRQKASQKFSEEADAFTTLVYEQSGSLQPAADKFHLTVQTASGISKDQKTGIWSNPKLQQALFSSAVIRDHRNTPAIEVAPGLLVAARVTQDQAAMLKPLEQVAPSIEQRLEEQQAAVLARQAGEEKLKELQAGRTDPALTWSGERLLTRQQAYAGGLPSAVVTPAFRVDERHLPGYAGASTPEGGFVLVRVTQIQPGRTDESATRKEAETGLTRAYGDGAMEEFMAALRKKATIQVVDKSVLEESPQH